MLESTKQDFKANEADFFKWLVTQVEKSGVKILLNIPVTPALIDRENPDFLILAVGFHNTYVRPYRVQKALS